MASFDLVSFVPGVGNTKTFSPGAATSAAYAGPHTGMTDGTSVATSSSNMAEIYNRILLNITATIASSGITIDHTNWAQLPVAVQMIATAQAEFVVANYASSALVLNATNVWTGSNLATTSGVALPGYGTWSGIWIGNSSNYSDFYGMAGGSIIGARASTLHAFGVRVA